MRTHRLHLLAAAVVVCGTAACRDAVQPPQPGSVVASLTTPAHDDGAVLAVLTGTTFGEVLPASTSYRVYFRLASPTELRVVVLGNIVPGPLFTVGVPDIRQVGTLQASVADVAGRADTARASLSGYALTLASGQLH